MSDLKLFLKLLPVYVSFLAVSALLRGQIAGPGVRLVTVARELAVPDAEVRHVIPRAAAGR